MGDVNTKVAPELLKKVGNFHDRVTFLFHTFCNSQWVEKYHTPAEYKALLKMSQDYKAELKPLSEEASQLIKPEVVEYYQNMLASVEGVVNESIKANGKLLENFTYMHAHPDYETNPEVEQEIAKIHQLFADKQQVPLKTLRDSVHAQVVPVADMIVVDSSQDKGANLNNNNNLGTIDNADKDGKSNNNSFNDSNSKNKKRKCEIM